MLTSSQPQGCKLDLATVVANTTKVPALLNIDHLCLRRMRSAFSMKQDASQQSGISAKEAAKLLSTGQTDELMDVIYNKYVEYRKQHDLVIIEGLTGFEPGLGNVNELNAKVAATLETPVLLVLDSRTKDGFSSANDLANSVVSPALPNFTHPSAPVSVLCLCLVSVLCLSSMHACTLCVPSDESLRPHVACEIGARISFSP